MRYLALLLLLASCQPKQKAWFPQKEVVIINADSTRIVELERRLDSVKVHLYNGAVRLKQENDSLRGECKRLSLRVVNDEYTINRVRFYVGICNRKPGQSKFLRGWINRSLE